MVEKSDLEKMMNNLEKAKNAPGDGRERGKKKTRRAKNRNVKDTTDRDYVKNANYRFACPECDWEAYRKQARGKVKKIVRNPDRGECRECGHVGLTVESL